MELALGNIDLGFTVGEVDVDAIANLLAVRGGVEDVADHLTFGEGRVSDLALLRVTRVGKSNEELTTGVGVEAIVGVALNLVVVPDLGSLSLGVDLANHLVEVGASVHVLPKRLTVVGIGTSTVVLLSTIVGEGDTSGSESEGLGRLEAGLVATMVAKETSVIVIVNEDTESADVLEMARLLIVSVLDLVHGFSASEYVTDGVVHGVVEETGEDILVRSNVSGVAVEALSHLEDTGGLTVLRPEVLGDFRDSVDTDTVEAVCINDSLNPVLEVLTDVAVSLIEIGETSETAVLDGPLVVPVDITIRVIVVSLVEGVKLTEIVSNRSTVVSDNIDHHPDVLGVSGIDKSLQVISGTEVCVNTIPVSGPVAVIATIEVIDNWGDPDSIEAHTLDVIQVVDHALIVTTTVVGKGTTSVSVTITSTESIGKNLIDGALFPGSGVSSLHGGEHESGKCSVCVHSFCVFI